jgi:hypothetical protein
MMIMEWIIGAIVLIFVSKTIAKKKKSSENSFFDSIQPESMDSNSRQSSGLFVDLEKMLKKSRVKALKKENALIEQRIELEQALISKMQEISKKEEKTAVEYIAEAKAKADVLSVKILTAKGRKKVDLELKRSQEVENQKYWIRQILA